MTSTTFETVILGMGNNTGIEVPATNLAELGSSRRPAVAVTVAGYSYRSTVGVMGGRSLLSLPKAHRDAAGLAAGGRVVVSLVLEEGRRDVELPGALTQALQEAGLTTAFEQLAYSKRKEFARQVEEARADATRERRISKVLDALR